MKKFLLSFALFVMLFQTKAQTIWNYDFGANAVAAFNGDASNTVRTGTAQTGFVATQTVNTLSGGTLMTSATGNDGSVAVVTTGGSGTTGRLKLAIPSTSGFNKFGIFGIGNTTTTGSRTQSLRFVASFEGSGNYNVAVGGPGSSFSSNGGVSVNESFALLRFLTNSSTLTIQRYVKANSNYVTTATAGVAKAGAHVIEIFSNNFNTESSYTKGGNPQTIAINTYDVWVDGVLYINDEPTPGTISGNISSEFSVLQSFMISSNSTSSNSGTIYVDDIVYADYIPSDPSTLPVTLSSPLTAKVSGSNVTLNWATASENNSQKFEIYRSANGVDFTKIGEEATSSINGGKYSYVDYTALAGVNYYKLKQIDKDGKSEEFGPVSANVAITASEFVASFTASTLEVTLNSTTKIGNVAIDVVDLNGKSVANGKLNIVDGINQLSLPVNVGAGIYLVRLSGSTIQLVKKVIKN